MNAEADAKYFNIILILYIYSIMKTYHDTTTGEFVSKERVKSDPAGTVEITSVDLRQELCDFVEFLVRNAKDIYNVSVDEYLNQK